MTETQAKTIGTKSAERSEAQAEVDELDKSIGTLSYLDYMGAASSAHSECLQNLRKKRKELEKKYGLEPWWNAEP